MGDRMLGDSGTPAGYPKAVRAVLGVLSLLARIGTICLAVVSLLHVDD
jgi:hypothetical protein